MMFVCKRPKINEKEAGVGPFFKKNTTTTSLPYSCVVMVVDWPVVWQCQQINKEVGVCLSIYYRCPWLQLIRCDRVFFKAKSRDNRIVMKLTFCRGQYQAISLTFCLQHLFVTNFILSEPLALHASRCKTHNPTWDRSCKENLQRMVTLRLI